MSMPVLSLKQLARDMRRRAGADRRVVELARIRLGIARSAPCTLFDGHRWVDDRGSAGSSPPRLIGTKSRFDVERQLVVELRIDRVRRQREQDRVAVGRRLRDDIGADVAGSAAAVVDDDRLAQRGRERFVQDPRDNIGAATRRIGTTNLIGLVG